MDTEPNPYQSPSDDASKVSEEAHLPNSLALPEEFRRRIVRGRGAVVAIALVFGVIAVLSFCAFVYQATYRGPAGEWFVLHNPLWVLGHLFRALGLTILASQLWQYSVSLKEISEVDDSDVDQFLNRHTSLWIWGAGILFLLIGYGVLSVVVPLVAAFSRM
jgi:hypothetical protein